MILATLVILLVLLVAVNYLRPVPRVVPVLDAGDLTQGSRGSAPWASNAQSAFGALGSGVADASPNQHARPVASIAKVMTALVVLKARPLTKGESGPALTVSDADVTAYEKEKADQESVVAVQAGEQLSELQVLQGMLIPSGNNMSELLARWAFGSLNAAVRQMNREAQSLGMTRSTFADTSGASPRTASTPADLVMLGERAMGNEVIARIVSQPEVTLPVAGRLFNVNYILGKDGIFGIKTGTSVEAGACYLFAAPHDVNGLQVVIVGAVMGLTTLDQAFQAARALLAFAAQGLQMRQVITSGEVVGRYQPPWGSSASILARDGLSVPAWPGERVTGALEAPALDAPAGSGIRVGTLAVEVGIAGHATQYQVPIETQGTLARAGSLWRLTRTS
jgi:D-alanyl-D-alanine carboxypeptidase (penicillin-binding protein 5/6)